MQVSKSKLKAKLLEYLRLAEAKGEEIIITAHGRPVLKIACYSTAPTTEELFGIMRGKVTYTEDLTTSTLEEWAELNINPS